MDFVGDHYYKLNRTLLTLIGLWPYNDSAFNRVQRAICILLFAFSIGLQVGKLLTIISDLTYVFQLLSFTVPCLVFSLKYGTFCIKFKDIKNMTEWVKRNWQTTKRKEEMEILRYHGTLGYWFTVLISTVFYSFVVLFLITQIMPKVLDVVMPLNESRPYELLGLATLFFDQEKYFVQIFLHMIVALFVETTTILGTESLCLAYEQHICAMFRIASFRIKHAFDCEPHTSALDRNRKLHANVIDAIVAHNIAIEFFDFVSRNLSTSYFFLLALGVCSLSINMFRFFQAVAVKEMKEAFAISMLVVAHFFYMFINNFVAQDIINYSTEVFHKTCELPWYLAPLRTQRLLLIILLRSRKCCKFTMGHIFEGSLECFASLVSTSLSYFTIFWSLRD